MEAALLYLLKAHVVLALFVAAYYGLLRRLTFFKLNRAFLLLALLFAALYPALPMPGLLPPAVAGPLAGTTLAASATGALAAGAAGGIDWWLVAGLAYLAGTAALVLRLLGQLLSLGRVWRRARPAVVLGQPVRVVPGAGGPFSFGRTIYLSAAALADAAGLPAILRHEQAHVRQWHTLDVLLTQLATALAWPNPAAWLLRRAVLDNLEYLADRAALQTGLDRRAYQYRLLGQQPGLVPAPALAFHFSFLTLKNRIAMLNQPASTTRQLGRYLLAAPLIMALALGYSSAQAQAQVMPTPAPAQKPMPKNLVYYVDGKPASQEDAKNLTPDAIGNVAVLKGEAEKQALGSNSPDGTVVITTKAKANSPEVLAFNDRISSKLPLVPATAAQEVGITAAKAYIAKNHPSAKLEYVGVVTQQNQSARYLAMFTEEGKRLQLLFDGNGQPVKM